MNLDDVKQQINDWYNSEECELHFEYLKIRFELKEKRYKRFEEYIEENDFNVLMERLISEHDIIYKRKWTLMRFKPYLNNKLSFIFDYVTDNYDTVYVKELDSHFMDEVRYFKGFYFQIISGQGTIHRIYNKDKELILSL